MEGLTTIQKTDYREPNGINKMLEMAKRDIIELS